MEMIEYKILLLKWLKLFLFSIGMFLLPIKPLILSVGAFVVLDTIVGIIRSRKMCISITSKRFNQIWIKTLLYQGVVITTYFIDIAILNELTTMIISLEYLTTKLVCLGVIANEVKSIDESLKQIGIDLWSRLKDCFGLAKKIRTHIKDLE